MTSSVSQNGPRVREREAFELRLFFLGLYKCMGRDSKGLLSPILPDKSPSQWSQSRVARSMSDHCYMLQTRPVRMAGSSALNHLISNSSLWVCVSLSKSLTIPSFRFQICPMVGTPAHPPAALLGGAEQEALWEAPSGSCLGANALYSSLSTAHIFTSFWTSWSPWAAFIQFHQKFQTENGEILVWLCGYGNGCTSNWL